MSCAPLNLERAKSVAVRRALLSTAPVRSSFDSMSCFLEQSVQSTFGRGLSSQLACADPAKATRRTRIVARLQALAARMLWGRLLRVSPHWIFDRGCDCRLGGIASEFGISYTLRTICFEVGRGLGALPFQIGWSHCRLRLGATGSVWAAGFRGLKTNWGVHFRVLRSLWSGGLRGARHHRITLRQSPLSGPRVPIVRPVSVPANGPVDAVARSMSRCPKRRTGHPSDHSSNRPPEQRACHNPGSKTNGCLALGRRRLRSGKGGQQHKNYQSTSYRPTDLSRLCHHPRATRQSCGLAAAGQSPPARAGRIAKLD